MRPASDDHSIAAVPPVIRDCAAADVPQVVALLEGIWEAPAASGPVNSAMLHALIHTGACVRVVDGPDGRLRGALIAFGATSDPRILHLHVVGITRDSRGAGLGHLLMRDLAGWARNSRFVAVEWTFDPLVARNAHLYLGILGARAVKYLTDPYGAIDDGINGGQGSDRLLVRWDPARDNLRTSVAWPSAEPLVEVAADGAPQLLDHEAPIATVEIPRDIELLRGQAPDTARHWRRATRNVLADPLITVLAFDRERGYIVERRSKEAAQ